MIERLELKNFTVFNGLAIDLSPKVNVIIGENGTGKMHLLKAAYGLCAGGPLFKNKPDTSEDELEAALTAKLEGEVLPNLSDEIARKLPPVGKSSARWQRHPVQNCQVFNIETWNENFPKWPVTRLAAAAAGGT